MDAAFLLNSAKGEVHVLCERGHNWRIFLRLLTTGKDPTRTKAQRIPRPYARRERGRLIDHYYIATQPVRVWKCIGDPRSTATQEGAGGKPEAGEVDPRERHPLITSLLPNDGLLRGDNVGKPLNNKSTGAWLQICWHQKSRAQWLPFTGLGMQFR